MSRRKFLTAAGSAALALSSRPRPARAQLLAAPATAAVPELVSGAALVTDSVTLPPPQESGIQHIVVVTMENRSFDHLLGWLRGADGKQAGLSYTDAGGATHSTHSLAPDFIGCGHPDPDHSYDQSRVAYNHGAMDGFLRAGSNDTFAIGYYTALSVPFLGALAQEYLACDRYFASVLGPTFPNRMFLWAAQTDRLDDSISSTSLPTIFDRLSAAGISHQYYFNNLPYLSLWGLKYLSATSTFSGFLNAAAGGRLPAVSFIDPNFTILDDGSGNDDHPHADIRNGEAFLSTIFHALTSGPGWAGTVLIINFDEWGGFFEHVAPPRVAAPNNVDADLVNGEALLGFRLPAVVVSPFTRNPIAAAQAAALPERRRWEPLRTQVSHTVFDHTSVLKLIEWRWGLAPLTSRDASPEIGNLATAMNFSAPDNQVPPLLRVGGVAAPGCFEAGILSAPVLPPAGPPFSQRAGDGVRATPWAALARSRAARQWLRHPRFQQPSSQRERR